MRRKNHVSNVILLILVLLQPSYSIFFILIRVENNREQEVLNKTFENLESSQKLNLTGTPIYINGNSGWASTASSEEWCSGSGTFINPYIIENVIIDGQNSGNCIEIWYSNVYFIIRNCILYNSGIYDAGIKIEYSDNGKIINNKCLSNYHGIFIRNGINFNISNNFVNDNTHDGIVLESFLDNCTIKGNQAIKNYQHGIVLRQDCNDIIILDNQIEDHIYSGILIQGGSSNNIISGNTVINNRPLWGIWVYNSDFNTIEDNKISNNGEHGILIEESNNNLILDNIITYNDGNGIKFSSWLNNLCEYNLVRGNKVNSNYGHHIHVDTYSRFNEIYFNAFVDNGDLARDDGLNNTWDNGTIGNYWSDYNGLDANDDGIGDTPHFILGSSGSQDKFPIWDIKPPESTIMFNPYNDTNIVLLSTYFTLFADDGIGSGVSSIKFKINNSIWYNYTTPFTLSNYSYTPLYTLRNYPNVDILISFYSVDKKGNSEIPKFILIKLTGGQIILGFDIVILCCVLFLTCTIIIKKYYKNHLMTKNDFIKS